VVQAAVNEQGSHPPDAKQESARKGGLKGGRSRAQSISRERRIEIARQGGKARWKHKADTTEE
jgi:hypothetical protein